MKTLLIACSSAALMMAPTALAEAQDAAAAGPGAMSGDDGRHAANYTEDHPWVGLPVRGVNDERLGSVSFVQLADGGMDRMDVEADTDVETLVIETGGFFGFGDREVELDAGEARLEIEDEDEFVRILLDEDEVEALPEIETDDFDDGDELFDDDDNDEEPLNPSQ